MYSERTQVLLSPEQLAKLRRIAARDRRSLGAVIRAAVDAYDDPGGDRREAAVAAITSMDLPVDDWDVMKAEILRSQLGQS